MCGRSDECLLRKGSLKLLRWDGRVGGITIQKVMPFWLIFSVGQKFQDEPSVAINLCFPNLNVNPIYISPHNDVEGSAKTCLTYQMGVCTVWPLVISVVIKLHSVSLTPKL